jgi:Thymidylate kinase
MGRRGVFVAVEGTDGSGKSAVARGLVSRLQDRNLAATFVDAKRPVIASTFLADRMNIHANILWENQSNEPRDLLRDEHWVHLSASWYHAVAQHVIEPALEMAQVVVVDGWVYKLLARFLLKDDRVARLADDSYAQILQSDLVCLLDVDPEVAASRKRHFGFSETGNFDGLRGVTRENFIAYQSRVRHSLFELARRGRWEILNVNTLAIDAVVDWAAERIETLARPLSVESRSSRLSLP